MDYKETEAIFDECIANIIKVALEPSLTRPNHLFHYTNANGMLGIIDSRKLWATHYQYLNDSSELEYGYSLAKEIIRGAIAAEENKEVKRFLENSLNSCSISSSGLEFYITCFCEHDDVLSQWRAYGGGAQGYALGFEAGAIGRRKPTADNQNIHMRKVLYDERKQKELISLAVKTLSEKLRSISGNGCSIDVIAAACRGLRMALVEMTIFFKHPAYEVEHEWRILHFPSNESGLKFRDGPFGLTPYVELDISASNGVYANTIPLCSITASPSKNTDNSCSALKKMIHVKKLPHCSVHQSTLPVRS
ncbi:hypothetical protein D3C76_749010 [compost metagenome]